MKEVVSAIATPHQWQQLAQLKDGYQDSLFAGGGAERRQAATHINNALGWASANRRAALTVPGPRLNIARRLAQFQLHHPPQQYEKTPIGGNWYSQIGADANDRELLKIEYVYQSTSNSCARRRR